MADSERARFSNQEINEQALSLATSLPYLMVAYGLSCGWSADRAAQFCGRLFAKGWERLRGADAHAVVRHIALNLVCSGGGIRALTGDAGHAEARVTGLPDPFELELFGIEREDALRFCGVFAPMANYVECHFAWRVEGDEIVVCVDRPADEIDQAVTELVPGGGFAPFADEEISQQAISNASAIPYLMVAQAQECGQTPEHAAAFAASRFVRLWDTVKNQGALAIARRMAINVVACGGELMRLEGDDQRAETSVAGVPTEAEAAFFHVEVDDVDRFYGVLCMEAEQLGYRSTWRRDGNKIVLTVEAPSSTGFGS